MIRYRKKELDRWLWLVFLAIGTHNIARGQTQAVPMAVVGSTISDSQGFDFQYNYFLFQQRVQNPWSCFLTGAGGDVNSNQVTGLGWAPYQGPEALMKSAESPYSSQIAMYMAPDTASAYNAALVGCATFQPLFLANTTDRHDLRADGDMLGIGPPTWIAVSSGFSTSTHSEMVWGPQMEFFDAVNDITDPKPNLAMSFCASSTAARYANLKYFRTDWNVFDLRQGLRQASTFYNPKGWGWTEQGGYGFPLVPNQMGDAFNAAIVPTNSVELDAGPPLQPIALGKAGVNGPQVAFRWYNFRQSTFDHTRIKVGNFSYDAPGMNSTYCWDVGSIWPLNATNAEFFTVLTGNVERLSPPETYTQVRLPLILAQPRFISDSEFQFDIFCEPCANFDRPVGVYTSADLISWNFLQELCPENGKATGRDIQIGALNRRFYRAIQDGMHSQTMGFTRMNVPPAGSALIANQLDYGDNSIAAIFAASTIPGSITVTKQDPANTSSYDPQAKTWSVPDLKLSPGEGAWLYNPGTQSCAVRFVGDVREGGLKNFASANEIVSFMLPIPFFSYFPYQKNLFEADPLDLGCKLQLWDGIEFVTYYHDPEQNRWNPQTPPIEPGMGFLLVPGASVPTNSPAPWAMSYSAVADDVLVHSTDSVMITGLRVSGSDVVVRFISKTNQFYSLDYTSTLDYCSPWFSAANNLVGTGDIISATHASGGTEPCQYYRIRQLQINN